MSNDDGLRSIIPARFIAPLWPVTYDQIIVIDWLQTEVPMGAEVDHELLQSLCGWRNIDVYYYIKYETRDWTAGLYPGTPPSV